VIAVNTPQPAGLSIPGWLLLWLLAAFVIGRGGLVAWHWHSTAGAFLYCVAALAGLPGVVGQGLVQYRLEALLTTATAACCFRCATGG
jgi:hypothetical protein